MNKKHLLKTKPQYAKLLLACFLAVFSLQAIYAYDLEVDGIYYNINDDGTSVSVTSGDNEYSGDVAIPSNIKYGSSRTLDVTAIGDAAFKSCFSLTSISIPESVTSIGANAFEYCYKLTSISIPESVTSIGSSAFSQSSLTSISIPESVTSIGSSAFTSCKSLTSISLPKSVSIGNYAFQACSSLTCIEIPESVNLGIGVFSSCSSLISVICHAENVPSIASNTFSFTPLLSALYVPASAVEAYKVADYWKDIENIFAIEDGIELSVGEAGLATFCPTIVNIDISEAKDIAAYRATLQDNTVILTRAYKVRVGEGVLLRSLNGGEATETVNIAEGIIENYPNDLVGMLEDKWIAETDNSGITNFVLSRQKDGTVGFYKADFHKVVKGKAYLPVANYKPSGADAKGLRLVFADDNATGIDIAEAQQTEADGAYYTLSGVKVENPAAKGIYIKNGKKYVIK